MLTYVSAQRFNLCVRVSFLHLRGLLSHRIKKKKKNAHTKKENLCVSPFLHLRGLLSHRINKKKRMHTKKKEREGRNILLLQ
jgi:hypothetical protein